MKGVIETLKVRKAWLRYGVIEKAWLRQAWLKRRDLKLQGVAEIPKWKKAGLKKKGGVEKKKGGGQKRYPMLEKEEEAKQATW